MDKIIRNINAQLWREAKTAAAREGLTMKDMVEKIIVQKLSNSLDQNVDSSKLVNYFHKHQSFATKIIRGIDSNLWRMVKAQAAMEGRSMKDWVEWTIACWLQQRNEEGVIATPAKQAAETINNREKTKILRSVNEQLWRNAKARAFREGITMIEWVEEAIREKLNSNDRLGDLPAAFMHYGDTVKTKILRNYDENLWREVKARSAWEGIAMKEWVEGCIANALMHKEYVPAEGKNKREHPK